MMEERNLNLARKWRSKDFDHIIGQDVSIKILKNSLYVGQFFPVYLLSGQRGCGKTSTARVFAMAVNCHRITEFRKSPKDTAFPCLSCESCNAMMRGKHPDFIEIDAASHTGVDMIRTIIESSQLLPVLGSKKIYLIDEVHMLSKAACNALLKILEEPVDSVLFMLATTDPQKLLDTVRSRCLQLFFRPIDSAVLQQHLQKICFHENIACEDAALEMIVRETDGSARDALNLLEQVRFSSAAITVCAVQQVLGYLDDTFVIALIQAALEKTPKQVMLLIQKTSLASYNPDVLWQRMVTLLRGLLWLKHSVDPDIQESTLEILRRVSKNISVADVQAALSMFYEHEAMFARTGSKHALLELILLQLCQKITKNKNDDSATGTPQLAHAHKVQDAVVEDYASETDEDVPVANEDPWLMFLRSVMQLEDPLLLSIMQQGRITTQGVAQEKVAVMFSKNLSFFADIITETRSVWQPLLDKAYGKNMQLEASFSDETVNPVHEHQQQSSVQVASIQQGPPVSTRPSYDHNASRAPQTRVTQVVRESRVDVSDSNQWPKIGMVLRHFPGTVTHINEA